MGCVDPRDRDTRRLAAAAGISPALIEIEITESLLVKDSATVRGALERLRRLGCRIALDDFGSGYSSLRYLHELPIAIVKIDRTFIQALPDDASSLADRWIRVSLEEIDGPLRHNDVIKIE